MRTVFHQLAATLAVAGYAGFAMLSGLDRLATDNAAVPAVTAWPYARGGPYNAAQAAARAKQWDKAQAFMARALAADPVNERVIGGLGELRLLAGDAVGADAAFRVSVQRGWRDPATHIYWMAQSVNVGDFTTASVHADALLRQSLDDKARDQILDPLLDFDQGRDALAQRLRARPSWTYDFGHAIDGEPPEALSARADVMSRAGRGIWECRYTVELVDKLIAAGLVDDARRAHDAACAEAGSRADGGVNDPRFVRFMADGQASDFDWMIPDSADVAVNGGKDAAGRPLMRLHVSKPATTLVLTQRLPARPGTYRVSWRMPETAAAATSALKVTLGCGPDLAKAVAGSPMPGSQASYAAVVRFTEQCPTSVIGFWLAPSVDATIADIGLSRLGA